MVTYPNVSCQKVTNHIGPETIYSKTGTCTDDRLFCP